MTGGVFWAVIGAALLHAVWNALVKGSRDKRRNLGAVVLGHVPFAVVALCLAPWPAAASLPYVAVSIGLHQAYQVVLLHSYEAGDLTQVYPIARGSAPLLVAFVSVAGFGVDLSAMELLAIAILCAGVLSLAVVRRAEGQRNPRAAALALLTGVCIAGYSLTDGRGARAAGSSLSYYGFVAIGNAVVMALYLRRRHPAVLADVVRRGRGMLLLGGGASFAAYAVATWAFTQAPIALVAAVRETSIVFALLIGVFALGERLDLGKVLATAATLGGALLLRLARR